MSIFTGAGVAIVTPFNSDEIINYNKLDELLDYHWYTRYGCDHYLRNDRRICYNDGRRAYAVCEICY